MTDTTFQETVSACQRVLAVVALFSLFINLLLLTAPLYMLQMFDRVLTSGSEETLIFLTVIAVLAFLALGALEAVRNQVMVRMGGWLDRRLGGPLLAGSVTDSSASLVKSTTGPVIRASPSSVRSILER